MAEIRIERKSRGLGWLWLLIALVIVAVLAWYFLYPGRTAAPPATGAPPTTGTLDRGTSSEQAFAAGRTPDRAPSLPGGSYGEAG